MADPGAAPGTRTVEVAVIGGGQAALAAGYYLRRSGLAPYAGYVLLDDASGRGGAWARMWPTLRAFSPPEFSSLPGWLMPAWTGDTGFPPAGHVARYLADYETRYALPVLRPARVRRVERADGDPSGRMLVHTDAGVWAARAVISATGTFSRPFLPHYPGAETFRGSQLHTASYRDKDAFAGRRVVIVGGGNSAAQLLAEVSTVAETIWVTQRPPRFLPDDVDGRVLFHVATARHRALQAGHEDPGGVASLGDVVMLPTVQDARARGVLVPRPMFDHITSGGVAWADGTHLTCDVILWCTGFRPALSHLAGLGLRARGGHLPTKGTQAVDEPRLHLVGYGDWTGPASATLIGVGRTARDAVTAVSALLASSGGDAQPARA